MNDFERNLNNVLVDVFNYILKYEEMSLKSLSNMKITMSEAHLIEAINRLGGNTTVSEIAYLLNITVPTATVSVKKLENKGFVKKAPCSTDGRRSIVSLTKLGERIDKAHNLFHQRMVRNISRNFSDPEKKILLAAVKKLNNFFKEKVEIKSQ